MGTTSGHEAAEEAQAFSEGHTSMGEVMLEAFQPQENGEALAPVEAQYEADFIPSNTTLGVNAEMQTGRGWDAFSYVVKEMGLLALTSIGATVLGIVVFIFGLWSIPLILAEIGLASSIATTGISAISGIVTAYASFFMTYGSRIR